jgi:thiol-disulfide isomerase/thioredoxin
MASPLTAPLLTVSPPTAPQPAGSPCGLVAVRERSAARGRLARSRTPWLLALLVAALLPPLAVRAADAAAGPTAPLEGKLERLEGGKLRLSELRGHPLLLELWATWCAPCHEQARIVDELAPELADRGIAVLAVDVGEPPKVVREFLATRPRPFPVALDRLQELAARLDVVELPVLALLDGAGRVAGMHSGLAKRDEVLALLAQLPPQPAAD